MALQHQSLLHQRLFRPLRVELKQLPIKLESPESLPAHLVEKLSRHRTLFKKHNFLESVLQNSTIQDIADELESHLKQQIIHGYHCTKEPEVDYFKLNGLRQTDLATHQAEFLKKFKNQFTQDEIIAMKRAWHDYFQHSQQCKIRNKKVWAFLSRPLVCTDGTNVFFRYFGGEAIHKPLHANTDILAKLERLGRSVVVEVALPGNAVKANYEMNKYVLSRYHASIRPDAKIYSSEAHFSQAVSPADIIQVTPFNQFTS